MDGWMRGCWQQWAAGGGEGEALGVPDEGEL